MKKKTNLFHLIGKTEEDVTKRLEKIFHSIFYDEKERFYFEIGDDKGYLLDTGNLDARTEGISYGMMMAVQFDRQDIFDKLWLFAYEDMLIREGVHQGYFSWSVDPLGTSKAAGPAPDGEEYFALALFFAASRWGEREVPYNYDSQGKDILRHCLHQHELVDGGHTMWDLETYHIKFVPEVNFTDPSYHLPHFYKIFAERAYEEDREFWEIAAKVSVDFLRRTPHQATGMCSEYSEYNGSPKKLFRQQEFYSDAYRVPMNMGLDALWNKRQGYGTSVTKLQKFFSQIKVEDYSSYKVDGSDLGEVAKHPIAIIASNAAGSVAISQERMIRENEKYWLRKFWNTPLRKGDLRYYDNCLYLFSMMIASGRYKIY